MKNGPHDVFARDRVIGGILRAPIRRESDHQIGNRIVAPPHEILSQTVGGSAPRPAPAVKPRKLSYREQQEWEGIEAAITDAEEIVANKQYWQKCTFPVLYIVYHPKDSKLYRPAVDGERLDGLVHADDIAALLVPGVPERRLDQHVPHGPGVGL
jgi:hypothetical protein